MPASYFVLVCSGVLLIDSQFWHYDLRHFQKAIACIIFVSWMRKVLATISVFIYFAFTCGVMINMHYCMDKVDSVKLFAAESKQCDKCGMEAGESNCCHDDVSIYKVSGDQQIAAFSFSADPGSFASVVSGYVLPEIDTKGNTHISPLCTSPPPEQSNHIYIQNCVFRV